MLLSTLFLQASSCFLSPLCCTHLSSSLGQAAPNLTSFVKGKAAGYNILEMIKRKPAINVNMNQGQVLSRVEGHIELCDVTFSYPSRPNVVIFQNFSLKIPVGKTIALVGASGSGKSTVISLIERFYDPTTGIWS